MKTFRNCSGTETTVVRTLRMQTKTRRPLSTGIFSATLIAKKRRAKERIEPTTYWLGNTKKLEAPARVRTHDLLAGKAISEVHFT